MASRASTTERPSATDYFMTLASVAATRGTCLRKQVGAVFVVDGSVVATGYNGSAKGRPHCTDKVLCSQCKGTGVSEEIRQQQSCPGCFGAPLRDDVGCEMEDGHCVRSVHAEMNAVAQAAKRGASIDGAVLYTTAYPCYACAKVLVNAGVSKVYYGEAYRLDERVVALFAASNIPVHAWCPETKTGDA